MAPHPDGGFVVVGRTNGNSSNRDFGVVRYKDDGSLDPASTATASSRPTSPAGRPGQRGRRAAGRQGRRRRARHHGGPITQTGTSRSSATTATARSTGASAGRQGHHRPRHDDGDRPCRRHRSDGRIVVAGTADGDVALVRYTTAGEVDTSFGDHGSRITDFGADDFANGVALTAGGQILVAGHTLGSGLKLDFALARYSADGALDESFGTRGIVKTDIGGGDDFAENLTVQPDRRIVVVGRATSPTILDMAVVRYREDGTPRHRASARAGHHRRLPRPRRVRPGRRPPARRQDRGGGLHRQRHRHGVRPDADRSLGPGDQARAPPRVSEGERPADEDQESVLEADEVEEVDDQPAIQAMKPLSLAPLMSATAAARPIVARLPLSR